MTTDPMPRPWLAHYADGVPADVDLPTESLYTPLEVAAARFGDRVALDFFGAATSYAELEDGVARAAHALRELGVRPGDRVALVLPNCPQHVVAFYAVLRLGAIVVEHNPLSTAAEFAQQFADHGAEVAVCWDRAVPTVVEAGGAGALRTVVAVNLTAALPRRSRWALRLPVPRARSLRASMTGPVPAGTLSWERLVGAAPRLDPDVPRPGPDDVAALQYTGGTTGTPKGAVLSHRNLRVNAVQGRAWLPGLVDGEETVYGVLPLFHSYGLTLCLSFTVSIAATLVLFPRFDVDAVLSAARRRPATFLPGVPPVYEQLATAARERGVDLRSIRYAISGAMSLPPATVALWEEVTGGLLVEGYGMTEASPVVLGNPISPARRPGTVGVPFPSTVMRIVDPDDPTVDRPPGDPGELLVRGPQVFDGYWNQPEETAAVLLPGGWLRTGDIVIADEDGYVRIVDRLKELIITGGFNVYPSEVEDVLRGWTGSRTPRSSGLPRPDGGERVTAAVVLAEGRA